MNTASLSERLAHFVSHLRLADVPAAVRRKARQHLLDTAGVALAGSSFEFGAAAATTARSFGGPSKCSVFGSPTRVAAEWAALANGITAHGLDYDDTHLESVLHVSAGVLPAALAAAETTGATGCELLTAYVAGLEVSIRIGLAARGSFHDHGFHPTGLCNAFAAALVAGRLYGLSVEKLVHAVGIAGSQAAGLLEFLTDGADVKRVHAGWAAHSGLVAASLAAAGFTGPRAVLEGRFGLYRSHLGERGWDATAVAHELGTRWEVPNIAMKPYPCCHFTHAFIDAAAELRRAHELRPESIESVECLIAERVVPVVCEPAASKRRPQTDYDAKFSVPYAVATMLVRGSVGLSDFTGSAIGDPAVLALAERVHYRPDPETEYPRRFGGTLRIRTRDGRVLERREAVNRGSAERPLTDGEVEEKFRRCAGLALGPEDAEAAIGAVAAIEDSASIEPLMAALRGDQTRGARAVAVH